MHSSYLKRNSRNSRHMLNSHAEFTALNTTRQNSSQSQQKCFPSAYCKQPSLSTQLVSLIQQIPMLQLFSPSQNDSHITVTLQLHKSLPIQQSENLIVCMEGMHAAPFKQYEKHAFTTYKRCSKSLTAYLMKVKAVPSFSRLCPYSRLPKSLQ